jgi:hypothetical protein
MNIKEVIKNLTDISIKYGDNMEILYGKESVLDNELIERITSIAVVNMKDEKIVIFNVHKLSDINKYELIKLCL